MKNRMPTDAADRRSRDAVNQRLNDRDCERLSHGEDDTDDTALSIQGVLVACTLHVSLAHNVSKIQLHNVCPYCAKRKR